MPRIQWDADGSHLFETGIDRGMLYVSPDSGVAWNGLMRVSETPIGGTPKEFFIDGQKYLLLSALEEFSATIEAFSSPREFAPCEGLLSLSQGLFTTNQPYKSFGFSYRTLTGDDIQGTGAGGYKLHIVYNALAKPTDHAYRTSAANPGITPYSWSIVTIPEEIEGFKSISHYIIDSETTDPAILSEIEDLLYGTEATDPQLPSAQQLRQMLYPQISGTSAEIALKRMAISGTGGPELEFSQASGAIGLKKMQVEAYGGEIVQRVARLIGFGVARGEWTSSNNTIGPGQTHRLFRSTTLPSTFDADGTPEHVVIIQSYKTMNTNVASYIHSIPASRTEVWLIYFHEPENDMSAATFNANFRSQANLVHAQGDSRVKFVYVASGYQYSGNVNAAARDGDYASGLGNGYADIFALDCYQGKDGAVIGWDWTANGIETLSHWVNWVNVVTNPAIVGTLKPLALTEYGVDNPVGDTNRHNRIHQDHDYLVEAFQGPDPISPYPLQLWEYWWQNADVANPAKFTDSPTILLWKSFEQFGESSAGWAGVSLKKMKVSGTGLAGETVSEFSGGPSLKKMAVSGASDLLVPFKVGGGFGPTGQTQRPFSVTRATSAGDTILVNCSTNNAGSYPTGCSDSKGNVYTLDRSAYANTPTHVTFHCPGATGGSGGGLTAALDTSDTITITMNNTSGNLASFAVCAPAAITEAIDVIPASISTGTSTTPSASATPTQDYDIAIVLFSTASSGGDPVVNSPYTDMGFERAGTSQYSMVGYRILGAGTSGNAQTATGTVLSSNWKEIMYLLKRGVTGDSLGTESNDQIITEDGQNLILG